MFDIFTYALNQGCKTCRAQSHYDYRTIKIMKKVWLKQI